MNLYFTIILQKSNFYYILLFCVYVGMCMSTAYVWSEGLVCPGIDLKSADMVADRCLYLLSQLQGCHPIFKLLYLPIPF